MALREGYQPGHEPTMHQELRIDPSMEPREEQTYEMLFARPGLESFLESRNVETGQDLKEEYQNTILPLITEVPWNKKGQFDGVTSLIGMGPTGSRKSTTMGALFDIVCADPLLQEWADGHNLGLTVLSNPTSMVSRLAKLRGIIPQDLPSGAYGPAYRQIAELKWELTKKYAIDKQGKGEAIVLIDEMGSLSSLPKMNPGFYYRQHAFKHKPIGIENGNGQFMDRANSPSFSLALDSRTRNKALILAMLRENDQAQFTNEFRTSLFDNYLENLTASGVWIQFSSDNGNIVRANAQHLLTLEKKVQDAFTKFMTGTMNSPQGMRESDANFEAVMESLGVTKYDDTSSLEAQKELYKKVQEKLNFMADKTGHFIPVNSIMVPEKTLSLDYFRKSAAALEEPDLVSPLNDIVIPALTEVGEVFTP